MESLLIRLKKPALVVAGMVFAVTTSIVSVPARTNPQEDTGAQYRSKCLACHGATAEKKFDTAKADDELIQIVLKGKKSEKPPNMPGYEEKGISADQAKALVEFMRSQKK